MFFNSVQYFCFFVFTATVSCTITKLLNVFRRKSLFFINTLFLLTVSYYFYMQWNAKYALLIFAVTAVTYIAALLLDAPKLHGTADKYTGKLILTLTLAICIGLLIYFKYANFLIKNINACLTALRSGKRYPAVEVLLPVGISFYIFQALGYVMDVYRGDIEAERNPLVYALFISFFPQLVAGPIERSRNLLQQIRGPKALTAERLREGLIIILFGLWQKIVIADNIATIVDFIFCYYQELDGAAIAMSVMLFGIQIYCDFDGYSNIAIGSAKILGIDLMKNFRAPYLAIDVQDFWTRWHISLTSWFRDYLYIPLGGNRKGVLRKYINTLVVFLVSGAWHGAAWNYILWGLINGVAITGSKLRHRTTESLGRVDLLGKRIGTFLIISFTWLFFRAESVMTAFEMIKHSILFPGFKHILLLKSFDVFVEIQGLNVTVALTAAIVLLFLHDLVEERTGNFVAYISKQKALYRWGFYLLLIYMIITFGVYGEENVQSQFIYFQF